MTTHEPRMDKGARHARAARRQELVALGMQRGLTRKRAESMARKIVALEANPTAEAAR